MKITITVASFVPPSVTKKVRNTNTCWATKFVSTLLYFFAIGKNEPECSSLKSFSYKSYIFGKTLYGKSSDNGLTLKTCYGLSFELILLNRQWRRKNFYALTPNPFFSNFVSFFVICLEGLNSEKTAFASTTVVFKANVLKWLSLDLSL